MTGNLLVPSTLKLHIFDAFFFNVVAVIKTRSVRQIHKQTHFHLERITLISCVVVFFTLKCHLEIKSSQSYLLLDFLKSWTACPGEICSPLGLGHRIWDPTSFSLAGIYLWMEHKE